jgi:cell division protein FtsB
MGRKRAMVKVKRLEARTRVIRGTGMVVFVCFCLSVGFVVVATAFPQKRALGELERKLEAVQAREDAALAEREYHEIEYRALREDLEYLEIQARDRLGFYREGERVLKFRRDE